MTEKLSKNSLLSLYRLNRPSFLLMILPYIAFNWSEFLHSPFFSTGAALLILLAIVGIDIIVKALLQSPSKISKACIIVLISSTIVLFYGYYFLADLQQITAKPGKIPLRMRTIFILVFVIVTLIQVGLYQKKWFYTLVNSYLLIFSILVVFSPERELKNASRGIGSVPMHPLNLPGKTDTIKPVILLIADEYQSPEEMTTKFGDTLLNHFSKSLSKNGWLVKNSFLSEEYSTIHSISSLLNFNLSRNTNYRKQSVLDIGTYKLSHPALIDSLHSKNVNFINYGIFNLGKSPALTRLYFYPTNYLQHFLIYTSFFVIKYNTGGFDIHGFQEKYSPYETHSRRILQTLSDTVASAPANTFIYAHLMMPHKPFQFTNEFPLRITNTLADYKDYWNFTNKKLEELLTTLTKENKYRIILTGDHGYRMNDSLSVKNTFSAYYGFDSTSIQNVQSVQDLGSLIYKDLH